MAFFTPAGFKMINGEWERIGETTTKDYSKIVEFNRHGGAYDRGSADSYYGREFDPHYFVGGTYMSEEVAIMDSNSDDYRAYEQGWKDNEKNNILKKY